MHRYMMLLALAAALLLAAPATAAKPQRGCPPPFQQATIAELVTMWLEFDYDPEEFAAFLGVIDANGNQTLCFAPFPEHSAAYGKHTFFVANFIDDVSNSQK